MSYPRPAAPARISYSYFCFVHETSNSYSYCCFVHETSIYIYQVYIYQVLLYICTSSGSAPLRRVMRAKRMKKAILLVLESTAEQEQEREQARSNQTMHNSDRDELSHELRCSLAPCVPSRPPKTMPAKGVCEAALTEYVLSTPHWLLRTATLL